MKYLFSALLLCFSFYQNVIAQVTGGNAFQTQNIYTGYAVSGNDIVLPVTRGSAAYGGKPYFSKDWVSGSVTTTDKNSFSDGLVFLYDKVNSVLYFKNKDSNTIMKADMSKISSFALVTDRSHTFINGNLISKEYNGKFFEVLLLDEKHYSFLKLTETDLQHTETSKASQAMTESISAGSYVDTDKYFILIDGNLQLVELKKKSFPEVLGKDEDKAESYIKSKNGNFNETYVVNMLTAINDQIK
jgi:hypothetical protein